MVDLVPQHAQNAVLLMTHLAQPVERLLVHTGECRQQCCPGAVQPLVGVFNRQRGAGHHVAGHRQFAQMGETYCREILGVSEPRVGVLSIGEEESKGNAVTKEVLGKLRRSRMNFIGHIEGRDIFTGNADVIVSDGFTGNVSLKAIESVAEMLAVMLRQEIGASWSSRLGYLFARSAFKRFRRRVDYAEYGGMPLLGVKGSAIICHGRSSAKAIKNAVRVAADAIEHRVNDRIQETMNLQPEQQAV